MASGQSLFCIICRSPVLCFFFFNDTATTEIYTLSLHDALPIWRPCAARCARTRTSFWWVKCATWKRSTRRSPDRKSTRLNSSHLVISYAVFCLKKKKRDAKTQTTRPPHPHAQRL